MNAKKYLNLILKTSLFVLVSALLSVFILGATVEVKEGVFTTDNLTVNNKVGIGTTSPTEKFEVKTPTYAFAIRENSDGEGYTGPGGIRSFGKYGTKEFAGIRYRLIDGTPGAEKGWIDFAVANPSMSTAMVINNAGNVGIGTTGPTGRLDIKSSGVGTFVSHWTASDGSSLGGVLEDGIGAGSIYVRDEAGNSDVLINTNGATYFTGGNVGIGTASPDNKLTVSGSGNVYGSIETTSASAGGLFFKSLGRTTWLVGNSLNTADRFEIGSGPTGATTRLAIDTSGNVGIGTTTPGLGLTVNTNSGIFQTSHDPISSATAWSNPASAVEGLVLSYDATNNRGRIVSIESATAYRDLTIGGNSISFNYGQTPTTGIFLSSLGRVGIGTTNPGNKLGIVETISNPLIRLEGNNGQSYGTAMILAENQRTASTAYSFFYGVSDTINTNDVEFNLRGDGTGLSDLGWTTPADVAEWTRVVDDPSEYEPGDLVMISAKAERSVEKAKKALGVLVGVVTLKPGLTGVSYDIRDDVADAETSNKSNIELEEIYNAKIIALLGYTPIKVSTEGGPLKPGDPITASGIPGVGMKAAPGDQIVGYAFESFDPRNGKMGTNDVKLETPIHNKPFHPLAKKITLPDGSDGWQGWVLGYVK